MIFKAGATSRSIDIFIQDSSSTIGAGLSGLAFNTSGLKCYYRKGATGTLTAVTLATQTVGGAYSSGGFVEIDATNAKGQYRFDIPDTVIASAGFATLYFYGAANMAPVMARLQIVSYDPEDATALGLSRLDAAITSRLAPTTAGRTLDVSTGGEAGLDWANVGSPTTSLNLSGTTVAIVTTANLNMSQALPGTPIDQTVGQALYDANNGVTVNAMASGVIGSPQFATSAIDSAALASSAAVEIAAAVWDEARSGHTTAGTFGAGVITTYAVKKNTAFTAFVFVMTDSTNHAPATGKTITATRSIDGGAFAACTNAASEVSDGAYKINFSAADLNGGNILFKFAATGCDDRFIQIVTQSG